MRSATQCKRRYLPYALLFTLVSACAPSERQGARPGDDALTPGDEAGDPNGGPLTEVPGARVDAPQGFELELVAEGFDQATAFAFAPGERIFVAEKRGTVRVVRGGELRPAPFVDLSDEVSTIGDRGLLALAVHPDFPSQPYIYLFYTYDPPETATLGDLAARDGLGARVARLVRLEADPASDYDRVREGSALVLLGAGGTAENIPGLGIRYYYERPACGSHGAYVADCIPVDETTHTAGMLRFGPDGALYASHGDGCDYTRAQSACTRALDVDSLAGKILRIDPATGRGLPDNPFAEGDLTSDRSKVFALGLRNPFRFTFDGATGSMYVGDVGWNVWEEVNRVEPGANFGWPCHEGGNGTSLVQPAYVEIPRCRELAESGAQFTPAIYAYAHRDRDASSGSAIVLGDVYRGSTYPPLYRGALFYADFNLRELRFLTFDRARNVASSQVFLDTKDYYVQIESHPQSGDLYLLSMSFGPGAPASRIERLSFGGYGPGPAAGFSYRITSRAGACLTVARDDALAPRAAVDGCDSSNGAQDFWFDATGDAYRVLHAPSGLALAVNAAGEVFFEPASDSSAEQRLRFWPLGDAYQIISEANETCLVAASFEERALATDECSSFEGQLFRLVPLANEPPSLAPVADQVGVLGAPVSLQLFATDSEQPDLTFFATNLPPGTSIDPPTGLILGTLTQPGSYVVRVRVTDGQLEDTRSFLWTVQDDLLPNLFIDTPRDGHRYTAGERILFAGRAVDHLGMELPMERLAWELLTHHNQHVHPSGLPATSGASGSFVVEDHGDNTALELCVSAEDGEGRRGRTCRLLRPKTVEYTIDSVPPGLIVPWEGVPRVTPYTVETNVGGKRDLAAPRSQEGLTFVTWSDGVAGPRTLEIGEEPRTFVAIYASP